MTPDLQHLAWPFFADTHRGFARELADWAGRELAPHIDHADVDARYLSRGGRSLRAR